MMMRRIRKRNAPPATSDAEQEERVEAELPAGDAGVEVVDGVLEHPRRRRARRPSSRPRRPARRRTAAGSGAGTADEPTDRRTASSQSITRVPRASAGLESADARALHPRSHPLHPRDRLPLLQRLHRRAAPGPRRHAASRRRTPATTARTTTRPRAGCCSATTSPPSPAPGRSSARCWPRSSASRPGLLWLVDRRRARRRGARLRHPLGVGAPRRPLARRDRARRRSARWPASPPASRSSSSSSSRSPASAWSVVNALGESAWGTFTIGATIPIALFMGFYMYRIRKGQIAEATVIGVVGLLLRRRVRQAARRLGHRPWSSRSRHEQLVIAMARLRLRRLGAAGLAAARPRDYLSAFMKIGTIALLVVGRHRREPRAADAGRHAVRRGRRADHPGHALPVRLHHHRLRRHLRLPRPRRLGHDAEDDRQGVATSGRSATARC